MKRTTSLLAIVGCPHRRATAERLRDGQEGRRLRARPAREAGIALSPASVAVINYYGEDAKTFNGFYVKQNSEIKTARDLIGKKIGVNTLGAHSEAVIDTYLEMNGLSPDEIKKVELVVVAPITTEESLHGSGPLRAIKSSRVSPRSSRREDAAKAPRTSSGVRRAPTLSSAWRPRGGPERRDQRRLWAAVS